MLIVHWNYILHGCGSMRVLLKFVMFFTWLGLVIFPFLRLGKFNTCGSHMPIGQCWSSTFKELGLCLRMSTNDGGLWKSSAEEHRETGEKFLGKN